ncbi:MAG: four helix bundle protein [Anaerolineaceae bacterium]|nr:four helix bundle protein [Anaerolineaceae bacterium]
MAKGDNLEARLVDFAVMVIHLTDKMPSSRAGNHVAGQLLRSGTSPAAHYAEARGAESNNDFIHKLKVALKELNESRVWLKVTIKSKMMPNEDLSGIYQECDELCRIVNASIKTSKQRKNQRK